MNSSDPQKTGPKPRVRCREAASFSAASAWAPSDRILTKIGLLAGNGVGLIHCACGLHVATCAATSCNMLKHAAQIVTTSRWTCCNMLRGMFQYVATYVIGVWYCCPQSVVCTARPVAAQLSNGRADDGLVHTDYVRPGDGRLAVEPNWSGQKSSQSLLKLRCLAELQLHIAHARLLSPCTHTKCRVELILQATECSSVTGRLRSLQGELAFSSWTLEGLWT